MYLAYNFQPFGRGFCAVLGFTGKQKIRVLVGEGVDFHLVSLVLVFIGEPFVECRQSAAVGVSCSENDDFHRMIV